MCAPSYFGTMHAIQHLTKVRGQGHQHLRPFASHIHKADGRLWIRLCFGGEYKVDGV